MQTNEIERILREDPISDFFFEGVFPKDLLPNPLTMGKLYIINLDTSVQPGSHWCLLSTLHSPTFTEYFDSFGVAPPDEIIPIMLKAGETIFFSDLQLQSIISAVCGQFVIVVAMMLSRGWKLLEIISHFSFLPAVPLINDAYVKNVISAFMDESDRPLPFLHPDFMKKN